MGNLLGGGPKLEDQLNGKVIWITGASSGLGRSLAIESARRGAKIALSARDVAKLEAVKQECLAVALNKDTSSVLVRPLDMTNYMTTGADSFTAAAKEIVQKFGGIDILINNAGVSTRSPALETSLKVDLNVMDVNFWGPVALTKVVIPYLQKRKAGQIVVINSVQGKVGLGSRTSYSSSKHALTGYFDSLRAELSIDDIGVTAVFPGYIRTNLSLNALTGSGEKYATMDDTTSKGSDPTDLALQILKGMAAKKNEMICAPLDARAAIFFRNLLPNLVFSIIGKKARKGMITASSKQD